MTTDEAIHLLSARIDGPLPTDQQSGLDAWLAESPDHAVLAEAFQTQHGELQTAFAPRREAARQTAAAVARRLIVPAVPGSGRRWWRYLAAPLPAACAAAVLIALGLLVYRGKNLPQHGPLGGVAKVVESSIEYGLKPRSRPEAPKTEPIKAGESVATRAGEKRRLVLPDGSLLYLNQNTTVELPKDRHVKLVQGEVFVEVVPAGLEADRFLVETPKRSVTALGTKFAVTAKEAGTGVFVTQGKVEVSGLDQKLTTGQELLPGIDKIASAPRASAALDWTKDLMAAAESPLVPAGKHSGGSLVAVDPYGQEAKLSLVKYHVDVHVEDGFARTTIDQTYFNSENWQMEGTFYFPLPPDASLSRLAMYVDGDLMEGGMADRGHARDVYERIRYQNRDPALLEWVDGSVFKMRVFPLEARQEKRIILSYTQRLPVLYGRASYRFPAGHTLAVVDRWSFRAFVKDGTRMSAVSPSHPTMKPAAEGPNLILTDEERNAKVDRDVVLELTDHQAQANADSFRWSRGELDGQKYLMLRYRPDLPTAPRRERRDWVFLFESSGARDPLVARAQVEVIRALLTHAEHDDTFAVLSVGTRVRRWADEPRLATPENVAEAIQWLDDRHLIGALNLDQALSDVTPLLRAGSNPHLVHVGGGVASFGEQRADELVKRIPDGTRYVGIGVGKRVSPAFMKVAAERTGGLFTQVNPDEPIGWRGFEIASTLNAPRLLNVRVETPGLNAVRFLTFSNALAHGEELAAVANVTHAMPREVTIRGTLDGQAVQKVVPVSDVAAGAGYLPRTWAKLEIDRLLAENSQANQKAVTDLSKAMYVMTPFTSLLVLENEQMYKDFKVDRGRKDHWALYPCPPKIPVVYIPDPNQPGGARPDLKGQKPHANAVQQTVMVRTPPQFLTWPGHGGGGDQPVLTAGQRFGTAFAVTNLGDFDGELINEDLGLDLSDLGGFDAPTTAGGVEGAFAKLRVRAGKDVRLLQDGLARLERGGETAIRGKARSRQIQFGFGAVRGERLGEAAGRVTNFNRMNEWHTFGLPTQWADSGGLTNYFADHMFDGGDVIRQLRGGVVNGVTTGLAIDAELSEFESVEGRRKVNRNAITESLFAGQRGWQHGMKYREIDGKKLAELTKRLSAQLDEDIRQRDRLDLSRLEVDKLRKQTLAGDEAAVFAAVNTAPPYYGRPSFSGNQRVFTDLVAFAPGMSSSPADIRAVLEAEAAPRFGSRLGTIDPKARELIDAARPSDWKALRLGDNAAVTFVYDGRGRYAYERRLAFGLLERVVCDGTHLWHLYPELGIGAKRTVSRFHRAALFDLVPDFVPPADDLARGADVKRVDAKTVALVPLRHETVEAPEAWLEVHLVFDGSRLAERRWVARPKDEVLVREVYDGATTRIITGKQKELDKAERKIAPAAAPDLKPDVSGLVILPLPLRGREHVYRELGMEPGWNLHQEQNACFPYLDADSAMRLLACEFAANHGHNVAEVWNRCFRDKGDQRVGFYTLMAAAGHDPRSWSSLTTRFERDPADSLVRYLWELHDPQIHDWQARFGFGPPPVQPDSFLGRLTAFRRVVARWNGGHINDKLWGQRDGERARAIEFAVANADNVLGWCTLAMVQDRCPNAGAWKAVADGWDVLAQKSALRYPALYEQARCLGNAGLAEPAQAKYQELFRAALKEGVLPPLDSSFRSVLEGGKQDAWAALMREAAALCAKKEARPVIVTLAWQCYQLGDSAMADTLLDQALADVPAKEAASTGLAAAHFLNATGRYDRAGQEVHKLLADPTLAKSAGIWRLASQTADHRKDPVRSIECLERALDIEYDRLPEMFDVQPIRNDYGRLLAHYEWLADAAASLKVPPPKNLVARVVRAADRWRHLDPEAADVPNRAAAILRKAGGEGATELAWDYVTTPLALKPNEGGPWVSLAQAVRQEGDWRMADRCYELAFAAEPTNAQLLWDRAQLLRQQGQEAEGRAVLRRLADGEWQPRFNGLKAQARQAIEGR